MNIFIAMYRQLILFAAAFALLLTASCSSGGPTGPKVDLADKVIVAFGNSITAGVGDSRYPSGPAGYPYRLEQLLRIDFPNVVVLNRGVSGERTFQGRERLRDVLSFDRPDFVLILEGVNNLVAANSIERAEILQDLGIMVRTVKAAGAIPLLASLTPTFGPHGFKNPSINILRARIQDIANREDITFVDLNAAMNNEPDLTVLFDPDGLHLNNAGYELIAETWYLGLLGEI